MDAFHRAAHQSIADGLPYESLFGILNFLRSATGGWRLPVVWNCHGYALPETIALLDGVVDAFVPDFKYGNDVCAERLSGAPDYFATAASAISAMLAQSIPVLVRILVLPGHADCCHIPVLNALASMDREWLWVSLRGQYNPVHLRSRADSSLNRRVSVEEMERLSAYSRNLGLRLVGA